jgi:hypothetical protein
MLRKLDAFTALSGEEKMLFIEAFATLGIMRAAILTVSFKRLTKNLEHIHGKAEPEFIEESKKRDAQKIGRIIARAANNTPWESACLAQALTASRMLKRRGIPGQFYLGVMRGDDELYKMKAHAWSQCGDAIVTGGEGNDDYTILSTFAWVTN